MAHCCCYYEVGSDVFRRDTDPKCEVHGDKPVTKPPLAYPLLCPYCQSPIDSKELSNHIKKVHGH